MANWLSAAKRAFQSRPPKEPERFEIRCACEGLVTGVRTRKPQKVPCPTCSQVLLVLPESLYPQPKPPKPKPQKRPEKDKGRKTGSNRTMTEPVGRGSNGGPREGRTGGSSATKVTGTGSDAAVRNTPAETGEDPSDVPKIVLNRKQFTRLRLVVLLMCVTLGLTGYWMIRRSHREQAKVTLSAALKAGHKAVDEDDLVTAETEFQKAVKALDMLGQNDGSARLTRQIARELTACNTLASKCRRDLLVEAVENAKGGQTESWANTFRSNYRDGWLVVDAVVTPIPVDDPKKASEYLIDLPVAWKESQLVVELRAGELAGIERDGRPRRMILAGQLQELVPDGERQGIWRLKLNEKSAFLFTDVALLERMGWPRDAALELLTQEQAQAQGIER